MTPAKKSAADPVGSLITPATAIMTSGIATRIAIRIKALSGLEGTKANEQEAEQGPVDGPAQRLLFGKAVGLVEQQRAPGTGQAPDQGAERHERRQIKFMRQQVV